MIYGPYVRCPAGRYEAEFHLALEPGSEGPTRVRVDVATEPRGSLAAAEFTLEEPRGAMDELRLQFSVPQEVDNLEFRLEVISSGKRSVVFKGVRVSRAQGIGALAEPAGAGPVARGTTERIMKLLRRVSA